MREIGERGRMERYIYEWEREIERERRVKER